MNITALIDNYNYAHFISDAIDSVLNQTYPPYEIIVVDDGSSDHSVALVREKYGDKVRLITSKNRGQLHCIKLGVEAARGNYIAFLDADDMWQPIHLQNFVNCFADHPDVNFFIGNCQLIGARNGTWYPHKYEIDYGLSTLAGLTSEWIGAPTCALMIKRSLLSFLTALPDHIFREWPTRADDALIYGGSIAGGYKYRLIEPTACWRIHNANNSHAIKKDGEHKKIYDEKRMRLLEAIMTFTYGDNYNPLDIIQAELPRNHLRKLRNKRNLIKHIFQTRGSILTKAQLIGKILIAR
jgi:glycosyltransferase involved in cell wall biosynthesis